MERTTAILAIACLSFAMLMVVAPSDAAVDLADAYVIWLCDEDGGDTVTDYSGQENHGTLAGGDWVDGKFNGGIDMTAGTLMSATVNGVSNEVVTQAMWAKFDGFAAESQLGFIAASGTPSARFFYFSNWVSGGPHDGIHMGVLNDGGAWGRGMGIAGHLDEGEWYHLVGIADAAAGTHTVYINAVNVHESNYAAGEIPGDPIEIWAGSGPEGKPTQGVIDEIAFFSRALTEDEVVELSTTSLAEVAAVQAAGKLPIAWADLKR